MSSFVAMPLEKKLNRRNIVSRVEDLESGQGARPSIFVNAIGEMSGDLGNISAGAGAVRIDANGIAIVSEAGLTDANSYKFISTYNNSLVASGVYCTVDASNNVTHRSRTGGGGVGNYNSAYIDALGGIDANVYLTADSASTTDAAGVVRLLQNATQTQLNITGVDTFDFGGAVLENNGNPIPTYLPFGVNDTINPLTANGNPYAATVDRTLTMIKLTVALYVVTTNDGSNYWTISLKRLSDNAQVAAFNTSALSPDTTTQLTTTSFDIASVGTADAGLVVGAAKTGSPGNLYLWGPALEVSV
jgi:hypothetical protein